MGILFRLGKVKCCKTDKVAVLFEGWGTGEGEPSWGKMDESKMDMTKW